MSLPVQPPISKPTRLLPIRRGHMRRRFTCGRRAMLRGWLATELADVGAAMTGNGVDAIIDLSEFDPRAASTARMVKGATPDAQVDAAAARLQWRGVKVAPGVADAVAAFMRSADAAHFVLFVRVGPPPHIFAVVVERAGGPRVRHVLLLNPGLYEPREANYLTFMVALVVYGLAAGESVDDFRSLLAATRTAHPPGVPDFDLQEGDPDGGFCQHWDSFLLYNILVEGRQPHELLAQLAAMDAPRRGAMIVDWSNWAADQAA